MDHDQRVRRRPWTQLAGLGECDFYTCTEPRTNRIAV